MKEDNELYKGQGVRGPLYWLAGIETLRAVTQNGGAGGLGGLFGGGSASVEMDKLRAENTLLKANAHADAMNTAQVGWNATQQGRIDCLQRQVDELRSVTRLTIPNSNLTPGVGPVAVVPVPPAAVPAPAATPPTVTLDSATITALANAIKAA